jgi:hypothetical protein
MPKFLTILPNCFELIGLFSEFSLSILLDDITIVLVFLVVNAFAAVSHAVVHSASRLLCQE